MNFSYFTHIINNLPLYIGCPLILICLILLFLFISRAYKSRYSDSTYNLKTLLRSEGLLDDTDEDIDFIEAVESARSSQERPIKKSMPGWTRPYKFLFYSFIGTLICFLLPGIVSLDASNTKQLLIGKFLNGTAFFLLAIGTAHKRIHDPALIYWWEYMRAISKLGLAFLALFLVKLLNISDTEILLMLIFVWLLLVYITILYLIACISKWLGEKFKIMFPWLFEIFFLYSGKISIIFGYIMFLIGFILLLYNVFSSLAESYWLKSWNSIF
jgi:hypothetical protein